jgi:hypothetical protein
LDALDLMPIHSQLSAGMESASGTKWNEKLPMRIAGELVKGHNFDKALKALGLRMGATALFLLAPFTGGASLYVALAGLAVTGVQAYRSAKDYEALNQAARVAVTPGTELVEPPQVEEARMQKEADEVAVALAALAVGVQIAIKTVGAIRTARAPAPVRTGASSGLPPTPENIEMGTVRMEAHPKYASTIAEAEKSGFRVVSSDRAQVVIRKVIDEKGQCLRIEKELHIQPGMRYLDLEHEMGHIRQATERFGSNPPPTNIVIEHPGGAISTAKGEQLAGILKTDQNAVMEYHNRLEEYLRLHGRGAGEDILREHASRWNYGIGFWRRQAVSKGMNISNSKLNQWTREHFPDLQELELKYNAAGGTNLE